MCHESSGVALTETIGVGKGSGDPRRHPRRRPASSSSARTRARTTRGCSPRSSGPSGGGARIVAVNPLPEAGLHAVQEPADGPGRRSGGAPRSPTCSCRSGSTATSPCSRLLNRRAASTRGARRPGVRRRAHRRLRRAAPTTSRASRRGRAARRRPGLTERRGRRGASTSSLAPSAIIVCWAMGLTQHRNAVATIREIVNFLLLRGNIGRPGAGVCPVRGHSNVQGDRTMGIYEKPAGRVPRRARRRVRLRAAARARLRHRRRHPGDARRRGRRCSSRMGGNFVAAAPDTEATDGGAARAAGSPCRSRPSSTARTSSCGEHGADPARASAAPSATTGGRRSSSPSRTRWAWCTRRAGSLDPAVARPAVSEVAIVCRLGRARSSAPTTGVDWAAFEADYDRDPRPHRRGRARLRATSTSGSATPGGFALPHPPRDARTLPDRDRAGPPHREPARRRRGARRAACCCRRCAPTTSTTRRSTGSTTATAASSGGRRVVFVHPDDLADARPRRRRRSSTSSASAPTASSGERRRSASSPTRSPRGTLRGVLPRGQRARAARQHRRGQRHPDVEVGRRPARASRGEASRAGSPPT